MEHEDWKSRSDSPTIDQDYPRCHAGIKLQYVESITRLNHKLSVPVHNQGIVHRDIKPANLLWSGDHITVKITDFGVSVYELPTNRNGKAKENDSVFDALMMEEPFLNRQAGTASFLAPEVCPPAEGIPFVQASRFALDTWALGVTYYCLLFGQCPWRDRTYWPLLNKIASTDFEVPEFMGSDGLKTGGRFPSGRFYDGRGVMNILNGLLTKDPNSRLTVPALKVKFISF